MLKKILQKIKERRLDPAKNINCSEFEVDNWSISRFIVKKLICKVGFRPFPVSELTLMTGAVAYFKPTHIFEWGTHIGKSARVFYEITKYYRVNTEIHSIDLPDDIEHVEHPGYKRGKLVRGLKDVFLHQGDGLDKSLSLLKEVEGVCRPLFYVDGDHSYESVRRELSGIIANVSNAVILLHDTFYQSEEANYNIGPFKAINEVLAECGVEYKKISTNIGLPGMTLLYKK